MDSGPEFENSLAGKLPQRRAAPPVFSERRPAGELHDPVQRHTPIRRVLVGLIGQAEQPVARVTPTSLECGPRTADYRIFGSRLPIHAGFQISQLRAAPGAVSC